MKKMDTKMLHISEVRVAERIRKDNGGLEELANDIHEHGLINPITVMEQSEGGYVLIAGLRRLKAMERMGAKEIRATVMTALEADEMLMLEIAENEQRKEFTVSEKLAFAEKLKAVEAEKARVRKSAGGKGGLDQDEGGRGGEGKAAADSQVQQFCGGQTATTNEACRDWKGTRHCCPEGGLYQHHADAPGTGCIRKPPRPDGAGGQRRKEHLRRVQRYAARDDRRREAKDRRWRVGWTDSGEAGGGAGV